MNNCYYSSSSASLDPTKPDLRVQQEKSEQSGVVVVMRLSMRRSLRLLLALAILLFITLNMHVYYYTPGSQTNSEGHRSQDQGLDVHFQQNGNQSPPAQALTWTSSLKSLIKANQTKVPQLRYHHNIPLNDSETLKLELARLNAEQQIHNLDKFQLNLDSQSLVMVIQAHDRAEYLRILLDSMKNVRDIHKSLLIVSHDVYSPELNAIIESVDFCPVMQIFFPFSQQIYSHEFPGEHPNDCPRDIKKDQAMKIKCNNAESPDKYGHYREAKYCQAKHHWIWKLQHVFEEIHVLNGYEGSIMLLEDDYYLSEDIIITTQSLKTLKEKECPECRMLVLGNYEKNQNFPVNSAKVERAFWISSKHNMGMTFSRSLWLDIQKCAKEFCNFDDYNWDWTLQHLSVTCIPDKIKLLVMKATRIFHIGECGMHKKANNCDSVAKVQEAETKLRENRQHLYPTAVSLAGDSRFKLRDPKPNGGWGDVRDHRMCEQYLNITAAR